MKLRTFAEFSTLDMGILVYVMQSHLHPKQPNLNKVDNSAQSTSNFSPISFCAPHCGQNQGTPNEGAGSVRLTSSLR
jgi:hypothetical protein